MERKRTVLIVEADADERERLGGVLEHGGYDVVLCSGPTGPDYVCIGEREGRCPLVSASDVVVLDLWLKSDTLMMGTPSDELLQLYLAAGRPVITLGGSERFRAGSEDEPVERLARHPEPEALLGAVKAWARWDAEGLRHDYSGPAEQGARGPAD
jgi:CheY-like chemotaxis protein